MSHSQFDVVVTGDSILQLGEELLFQNNRFVDVESGRQLFTKGAEGRYTQGEACEFLNPLVEDDGYFVFQDNGLGAGVTQTAWRTFLSQLVASIPDSVTIVGVLPVYLNHATHTADVAAKANIMVDEFNNHPLYDWVRWNQQVAAHPELVGADGQHPTVAGQEWLAAMISEVTQT